LKWGQEFGHPSAKKFNTTIIDAAECYKIAERRAADYFKSLYLQVSSKAYVPTLFNDIQSWKQNIFIALHFYPVVLAVIKNLARKIITTPKTWQGLSLRAL